MGVFVSSDEVDEIEVYGSEAQSGTLLTTYSFEVNKNGARHCLCVTWFSQKVMSKKFSSVAGLRQHTQHRTLCKRLNGGACLLV